MNKSILLIAPVHMQKEFYDQNSNNEFLEGQGQQSWVNALRNLRYDVTVFRYTDPIFSRKKFKIHNETLEFIPSTLLSKLKRIDSEYYFINPLNHIKNSRLKKIEKKFEYIIISAGASNIFPETVKLLKNISLAKVYLLSGTNPKYSLQKSEKKMLQQKIIDVVVGNDRGYQNEWKKIGVKNSIVLPISAADTKLHKRIERTKVPKKFLCDVVFIGTLTEDRQKILSNLTNFDLKIWGFIKGNLLNELKPFYNGPILGKEMVKAINGSKIAINIQPIDMKYGGNMRTFEIPATSTLQIADRVDKKFYTPDKEIIIFKNEKDLIDKISYFLNHINERRKIESNAYKRTLEEHTYEKRFKKLFTI